MRFLYFDLGLYKATELKWMISDILPELGIIDYRAYGFEACHNYAIEAQNHFMKEDRIKIFKVAIGGFNGAGKLYHAKNKLGHSIFSSKRNVSKSDFEVVIVRKFSTWVERNNIDFKNSFVMIKVNIEGAEYEFFKDLINSGLHKHVNIVCGAIDDVKKVAGYKDKVQEYYDMLQRNGINCIPFTEYLPNTKEAMKDIIYETYNTVA